MKQTRQAVHAVKQSILLRCLWTTPTLYFLIYNRENCGTGLSRKRELRNKLFIRQKNRLAPCVTIIFKFYPSEIGNCNTDCFSFCHQKVKNFEISNLVKKNWNFAVIFQKYRKWNRKSTMYFKTSWKPTVIPLKFCEMSLILSNLINYCKITQFLIKFCKSLKNLRKYC
jgi:hypothetical protein